MRYRQLMPTDGHTNIVVDQVAGAALRLRARDLSTELGRRVTISEALTLALADRAALSEAKDEAWGSRGIR